MKNKFIYIHCYIVSIIFYSINPSIVSVREHKKVPFELKNETVMKAASSYVLIYTQNGIKICSLSIKIPLSQTSIYCHKCFSSLIQYNIPF